MTERDPEPLLSARSLTKCYGDFVAVDRVDVAVEAGECWGLLGPNGAGKTTFLRMVIGNTPPDAGELRVLGYAIPAQARQMRARIGVVPQADNLDPDFTVTENLRTYGTYFGLNGKELGERLDWLLRFASLEAKRDARLRTLSGGMLRRLTLCRALVNEPEMLILDEPTTGLDPQARQLIWQRLRELRATGITLVLTTHNMEEAERLCDRITIMDHGRILDTDHPRRLIRAHIAANVVEVHGPGADTWRERVGRHHASRTELVGDCVFCYADDVTQLVEQLRREPRLDFRERRANLEDVFLKLTGRDLRDG